MDLPKLTLHDCRNFIESRLLSPGRVGRVEDPVPEPGLVGVELELFPYRVNEPMVFKPVPLYKGEGAMIDPLIAVAAEYGGIAVLDSQSAGDKGHVERIQFPNGNRFLFEPGGQVEISTAPADSLKGVEDHLVMMKRILAEVTRISGIRFGQVGTSPWFSAEQIGNQLIKPRYLSMRQYFDEISPYGKQMMLQTCAMHINLDLGLDPDKKVKRIVVANALVPFATALFAHSPEINGKRSGYKSYRGFLWLNLDHRRTGVLHMEQIARTMNITDVIEAYLQFALEAPLIYVRHVPDRVLPSEYTLNYWLKHPIEGRNPDIADLEQHFSLLFPEVRLKGYLELRSVDVPPPDWQMAPVCFYTGLLYSDRVLEKTISLLTPYLEETDRLMVMAIHGLESDELFGLSKKLVELAIEGLTELPSEFRQSKHIHQLVEFLGRFTASRLTFADM